MPDGRKPNRKDVILEDMFVTLLEVLKITRGKTAVSLRLQAWGLPTLRRVVQAKKGFKALRKVPLMRDAMSEHKAKLSQFI